MLDQTNINNREANTGSPHYDVLTLAKISLCVLQLRANDLAMTVLHVSIAGYCHAKKLQSSWVTCSLNTPVWQEQNPADLPRF